MYLKVSATAQHVQSVLGLDQFSTVDRDRWTEFGKITREAHDRHNELELCSWQKLRYQDKDAAKAVLQKRYDEQTESNGEPLFPQISKSLLSNVLNWRLYQMHRADLSKQKKSETSTDADHPASIPTSSSAATDGRHDVRN